MRRWLILGALAIPVLVPAPARAQDALLASCSAAVPHTEEPIVASVETEFRRMCAQVVNAVNDMQPAVGMAFSGGNPVLGTASTIGTRLGVPRITATARFNAVFVDLPDVLASGVGTLTDASPVVGALGSVGVPIGALQGDVAVGLFDGVDLAPMVGGLGALDVLGSVAVVPTIESIGLMQNIVNASLGARVGLLRQGLAVPGVSVSALYRRMGSVTFGDLDAGDPAEFSTNLSTLSMRAIASKGILAFDLAVGAGYDRYSSDVAMGWNLECQMEFECLAAEGETLDLTGSIDGPLTTAAWNVFGDVALNLLILNFVGEVGYQKAMDPITTADLEELEMTPEDLVAEELGGGRFFGSLGVRIAL